MANPEEEEEEYGFHPVMGAGAGPRNVWGNDGVSRSGNDDGGDSVGNEPESKSGPVETETNNNKPTRDSNFWSQISNDDLLKFDGVSISVYRAMLDIEHQYSRSRPTPDEDFRVAQQMEQRGFTYDQISKILKKASPIMMLDGTPDDYPNMVVKKLIERRNLEIKTRADHNEMALEYKKAEKNYEPEIRTKKEPSASKEYMKHKTHFKQQYPKTNGPSFNIDIKIVTAMLIQGYPKRAIKYALSKDGKYKNQHIDSIMQTSAEKIQQPKKQQLGKSTKGRTVERSK
ncbi:MAG: hypothetical protein H6Q69_959 [Firmicutes bacterium]|nr:hypothetical protein [Bacillota bacterium]